MNFPDRLKVISYGEIMHDVTLTVGMSGKVNSPSVSQFLFLFFYCMRSEFSFAVWNWFINRQRLNHFLVFWGEGVIFFLWTILIDSKVPEAHLSSNVRKTVPNIMQHVIIILHVTTRWDNVPIARFSRQLMR